MWVVARCARCEYSAKLIHVAVHGWIAELMWPGELVRELFRPLMAYPYGWITIVLLFLLMLKSSNYLINTKPFVRESNVRTAFTVSMRRGITWPNSHLSREKLGALPVELETNKKWTRWVLNPWRVMYRVTYLLTYLCMILEPLVCWSVVFPDCCLVARKIRKRTPLAILQ